MSRVPTFNSPHLIQSWVVPEEDLFKKGGPGHRVIFGYIYRTVAGILSAVFPIIILMTYHLFTADPVGRSTLIFFAIISGTMIFCAELMRAKVYERNIRPKTDSKSINFSERSDRERELQVTGLEAALNATAGMIRAVNTVTDKLSALAGIILLAPIFILVSALIKLDSSGPVFHTNSLVGVGGRTFSGILFRVYSKGDSNSSEPYILSRVGRFLVLTQIGALPLLFNLLKGDITLIGPSPRQADAGPYPKDDLRSRFAPGLIDPFNTAFLSSEDIESVIKRLIESRSSSIGYLRLVAKEVFLLIVSVLKL